MQCCHCNEAEAVMMASGGPVCADCAEELGVGPDPEVTLDDIGVSDDSADYVSFEFEEDLG